MAALPAVMALVLWGLWGFFPKVAQRYQDHALSNAVFQYAGTVTSFVVFVGGVLALEAVAPSLLVRLGAPPVRLHFQPRAALWAAVAGACGATGGIFYYVAASRAEVSLVVTLTALYPVVTLLLAALVLGERLELRQWIGIGLALGAMVLVAPRR